jgi:hypothetical protein
MDEKNDEIDEIIEAYDKLVRNIDSKATESEDGRAYGGIVRAGKGKLVESIAKTLIEITWKRLGQNPNRIQMIGRQIRIPIKKEYINRLDDEEVKEHINKNIENYYYPYKPDVLVSIDGKPIVEIECKAYTENAMLKRILVDATLLKTVFNDIKFILFELESQLGGDYSELKDVNIGSPSTHTLLSYFEIDLNIITLLEGERKVYKPIHKGEFFKPLNRESLEKAISVISEILEEFCVK